MTATSFGGICALREAAHSLGVDLPKATVAIQGYGNAGSFVARYLCELGCTIVAVSDSRGGIFRKDGLDPDAVEQHKRQTGSVVNLPGTEPITNAALLELPVDVLVPAAMERVITGENAGRIQARIVAELANGPTTPEADAVLFSRGIHVIPDILCSAGGVIVSYFEMVQNASMLYWDEAEVAGRLEKKITASYRAVRETAQTCRIDMRTAAYVVAVRRVVDAMRLRGWV